MIKSHITLFTIKLFLKNIKMRFLISDDRYNNPNISFQQYSEKVGKRELRPEHYMWYKADPSNN